MPIDFACPHCGKATSVGEEYAGMTGPCASCGKTVIIPGSANPFADGPAPPPDIGQDPAMRMLLPVGRSPWAIVAGYFGLLSILGFPAPIAIIVAAIAIRDIRLHPEKHGMGRAVFGLIMGLLFTGLMVVGIVGILLQG